jgi:hypothetical protein
MGLIDTVTGPKVQWNVTFNQPFYFGGDTVSGEITITSEQELTKVSDVNVVLRGDSISPHEF